MISRAALDRMTRAVVNRLTLLQAPVHASAEIESRNEFATVCCDDSKAISTWGTFDSNSAFLDPACLLPQQGPAISADILAEALKEEHEYRHVVLFVAG